MGVVKKTAKIIGKTIGTTILTATGITATILKTSADAVGNDAGSNIFGSAKDASFNGIKRMWSSKEATEFTTKIGSATEKETLRNARDGYSSRANAAKKMAEFAQQNGNEEKKREYEAEYRRCMSKYRDLDSQYRDAIKRSIK